MMGMIEFVPKNETQTREWFAAHIADSEYDLVISQVAFPDYVLRDGDGKKHRVEVEYKSASFIQHGHNPQGCDFVLCWIHNAELTLPVLELSTGRRYEVGDMNKDALSKEERPKSAQAIKKAKKEQVLEIISGEASQEYAAFVEWFAKDLKKLSEFSSFIAPTRIELLRATTALIRILEGRGVKIGNLHPSNLFELVTA